MYELVLYDLTLKVRDRVEQSQLGRRELARRLGTSSSQLSRLLDPANTQKSMRNLISILYILDCEVDILLKDRTAHAA